MQLEIRQGSTWTYEGSPHNEDEVILEHSIEFSTEC